MASFWGTLGDIAGGALDLLDPTPGNIASSVIQKTAGSVLGGGGGGGSYPVTQMTVAQSGGASMLPVPYTPPAPESSLGPYLEYLVPDVIERGIGTMPPAGAGGCTPFQGVVAQPLQTVRLKAPPGYRIVECPKGSGRKVAMLEPVARAFGYIKRRKKPPISVTDWESLKRADRTSRKLERVVKMSNQVTGKRKFRRCAPTPAKRTTRRR